MFFIEYGLLSFPVAYQFIFSNLFNIFDVSKETIYLLIIYQTIQVKHVSSGLQMEISLLTQENASQSWSLANQKLIMLLLL